MSNLLVLLGVLILAKFIINLSRYLTCNRYLKIYNAYLSDPTWKFEEIQPQIVKLFKEAGVADNFLPYVEPVGYDRIAVAEVSAMNNISVRRQDVVQSVTAMFHRAKGIYRSRMLDAINPLYWLLFVIFLPKNIFQYVGATPESALVKSVQVVYWLLVSLAGFLYSVFGNEINAYIKKVLLDTLGIK